MRLGICITVRTRLLHRFRGQESTWLRWLEPQDRLWVEADGEVAGVEGVHLCQPDYASYEQVFFTRVLPSVSGVDWLFAADDDTYVHVPRLRELLSGANAPVVGSLISCLPRSQIVYPSGGAGFALRSDCLAAVTDGWKPTGYLDAGVGISMLNYPLSALHTPHLLPEPGEFTAHTVSVHRQTPADMANLYASHRST